LVHCLWLANRRTGAVPDGNRKSEI
jgi:hypothetical protein